VVQKRLLSTDRSPEEHRSMMGRFLEVTKAQYLPCGRQTAFESSNNHGVEVYDFVENRKWVFAPNQGEYAG